MPAVMGRKWKAYLARLMSRFKQSDHCIHPLRMRQTRYALFVRHFNGRINIVSFKRIASMASRAFDKVKLGAGDASLGRNAVRCSRHFRGIAQWAGNGGSVFYEHVPFLFVSVSTNAILSQSGQESITFVK